MGLREGDSCIETHVGEKDIERFGSGFDRH